MAQKIVDRWFRALKKQSYSIGSAATAPAVSTDNQVSTANVIRIDIDTVSTTAANGLEVRMQFKGA